MTRWSPLISCLLGEKSMRYNELRRQLEGISHKWMNEFISQRDASVAASAQ
jgi:DNA-binding HxlR family transcriptional regulator